jgi:hypothetical protein
VREVGAVLAVLETIDQFNGLAEVAGPDDHDDIDGIEVFLTAEAACQIGFGIGGGLELRAEGTQKTEISVRDFAGDAQKISDEPRDGDVISKHSEFFLGIRV